MDEVAHEECGDPLASAFACKASGDMGEIQEEFGSVRTTIADLQASMQTLRANNHALRMKHRKLEQENGRLKLSIEETEYSQHWADFDAVEEHYREIERSRACSLDSVMEQCENDVRSSVNLASADSCGVDFAAGMPARKIFAAEKSSPWSSPVGSPSPICRDISSPPGSPRVRRLVTNSPFLNGLFSDREISKPLVRAPRW